MTRPCARSKSASARSPGNDRTRSFPHARFQIMSAGDSLAMRFQVLQGGTSPALRVQSHQWGGSAPGGTARRSAACPTLQIFTRPRLCLGTRVPRLCLECGLSARQSLAMRVPRQSLGTRVSTFRYHFIPLASGAVPKTVQACLGGVHGEGAEAAFRLRHEAGG